MAILSIRLFFEPVWVSAGCLVAALLLLHRELGRRQSLHELDDAALHSKFLPSHRVVRNALWAAGALVLLWEPSLLENPLAFVWGLGRWYSSAKGGSSAQVDWDFPDIVAMVETQLTGETPVRSSSSLSMPRAILSNVLLFLVVAVLALLYKLVVLLLKVLRYVSFRCLKQEVLGGTRRGPPRRVLIVHGSIGAGHKRAAQAVEEGLKERHPNIEVTTVDIVDFAGSVFNAIYKKGYLSMAEKAAGSHMVGYLFDNSNKARPSWRTRVLQELFLLDFIEYVYEKKPDVIVNTHFLSVEIIAGLRRRRLLHTPQVTIVTDYDAHAFWANYPTEAFFVGQEGAAFNLTHINDEIPMDHVIVSGIPTVPAFTRVPPREQCVKSLGLRGDVGPIVLLTASGAKCNGRPSIFMLYEQALSVETPIEIVVIAGRQKDLRDDLAKIPVPSRHAVKLEGFTKVMHEYMQAADIIVTKPGGLTTAESLAMGLAIAVVNPYPGQEMRNTDTLLEEGVAIKCNDLYLLGHKLQRLVSDKERLARMQAKSKQLGRPNAVFEICDYIASGDYGYIDYAKERRARGEGTPRDSDGAAKKQD